MVLQFDRAFEIASPEMSGLDDVYVINIPEKHSDQIAKLIRLIMKRKDVVMWCEGNELIALPPPVIKEIESDLDLELGVNDPYSGKQWSMKAMGMADLFNTLRSEGDVIGSKAKLAILDTGIDAAHEDISGHYHSTNEKYDKDARGHGTHCAGIAAAVTNNSVGIASFALEDRFVEVTSIKVLSDRGIGTQHSIIKGMIEAADTGADVISMSLGGPSNQRKQNAYKDAVEYAASKGTIVIVAAGNSSKNAGGYAPANVPGVITVSAVDESLQLAEFSNRVNTIEMAVAAPGVNIYSTLPGNTYGAKSGTSMATPHVAGLVSLMKAVDPGLNTAEVFDILSDTGKKTKSPRKSGPLIQAGKAIEKLFDMQMEK